jgi:hypothetical protein
LKYLAKKAAPASAGSRAVPLERDWQCIWNDAQLDLRHCKRRAAWGGELQNNGPRYGMESPVQGQFEHPMDRG